MLKAASQKYLMHFELIQANCCQHLQYPLAMLTIIQRNLSQSSDSASVSASQDMLIFHEPCFAFLALCFFSR
jgi:hypothetical protein